MSGGASAPSVWAGSSTTTGGWVRGGRAGSAPRGAAGAATDGASADGASAGGDGAATAGVDAARGCPAAALGVAEMDVGSLEARLVRAARSVTDARVGAGAGVRACAEAMAVRRAPWERGAAASPTQTGPDEWPELGSDATT